MKKIISILSFSVLLLFLAIVPSYAVSSCTETGFYRDGINMTAAYMNPSTLPSVVDATGCNVGVYFGPGTAGVIDGIEIMKANYYGVVVHKADIDIKNSNIHDIGESTFNGSQHGVGIYYATVEGIENGDCSVGTTKGKIVNNRVSQYQKGGIVISCTGTIVNTVGNTVTGLGPVLFIAQNGIQYGYGARGVIQNNTVDGGNFYTGNNWTSTGILIFETDNVEILKNNVVNNQTGIAIESWCWFMPTANNNKVINNTVINADYAVSIGAVDFPGYSTCSAFTNNNKVTNNIVIDNVGEGLEGLSIWTYDSPGSEYLSVALNNKVINNKINGYPGGSEIVQLDDTESKVHANAINP